MWSGAMKKHAPTFDGSCFKIAPHLSKDERGTITSAFSILVGFGTLQCRLPWFHRAVPSTTLDKVFSYQGFATLIITDVPLPCQRLPLSFFNKKAAEICLSAQKLYFFPLLPMGYRGAKSGKILVKGHQHLEILQNFLRQLRMKNFLVQRQLVAESDGFLLKPWPQTVADLPLLRA